jgi:hypothetical protein
MQAMGQGGRGGKGSAYSPRPPVSLSNSPEAMSTFVASQPPTRRPPMYTYGTVRCPVAFFSSSWICSQVGELEAERAGGSVDGQDACGQRGAEEGAPRGGPAPARK